MSWLINFFEVEFFYQVTPFVVCFVCDDDVRGGGWGVRGDLDEVEISTKDNPCGWVQLPQFLEFEVPLGWAGPRGEIDIDDAKGGEECGGWGGGEVGLGGEGERKDSPFGGFP